MYFFWSYFADIEAECQDDYMKIRVGFNGSFTGLLYSAGKLNAIMVDNKFVVNSNDSEKIMFFWYMCWSF